ncbi:MAG: Ig-like domain-containing protein, partial [Candidatus Marinimicrobia bacterium]|nr:Ig-like domain-containing protein [Candidatus Neomarinimicrobiota bacterium]
MKFKKHDIDVGNGGNVYDLVLEDINADGKMDIVTGHDQRVLWFKNDGAGNFTRYEVTQSNDVSGTRKVFAIDINGDNDIDILSASQSNDRINWYESSGGASPTWTTHMISDSADYAKSVHAADMDADGDIDVFSASTSDGKIAWYENAGGTSPTWTEHQVVLGSSADEAVFAAKLTSDNLVDIASGNGDLIIFEKGVSGPTDFSTHVIQTGTTWIQNMTGIDFDGDSDIDIVSANNYSQIYIWENQGFPTNTVHQISLTGGGWYVKAFHPYDIDQQGGIDFIVGPQFHGKKIAILLNKGSYNFDQITIWTSPKEHPYINAVKAANLDPDNGGDTDIDIVAGSQESTHRLFWLEQQIDNTTPTVKFISSEQLNGTYGVGEIIPVEVHFSRSPIDETGTPQLTLNVGGAATKTINRTSIKDSIMTFHYTVEAGHNSPGLDIASTTALTGTIKSFGSEVDLTLPAPGHANSLAGKKALVIDTTVPAVTNVSSTKLDGTYGPGELIPVTVEFDNNVTVMGPLTLDANWTTNSGHVSGTTHWQSFTAENSGKIRIIDLELQSPLGNNQAYSRSATGTLKIYQGEGNSGTELHSQPVTFLNKDNTWKTYVLSSPVTVTSGQQYTWEVNTAESERSWVRYFNSNAYAGGKSSNSNDREFLFKVYVEETAPDLKLTLDTGTTPNAVIDYASGTGTNTLTYNYTVAADHSSSDLDYDNSSSLVLNSGTVKDAGENDASFVLANPGDPESLGANKNINLDTDPPTVTFDPANGVTGVDLDKAVTITFSHDVRKIDDTPITNVDVATMFEFKQDDASGAPAATGVNATWDGVNNRITINHDNFPSIQVVYVAIKANMVEDDYNNPVAAENITFTVKDAAAPTVTFNPGDLETGVSLASDITITFNEAVRKTDDSALDDTNVDGHITLKEDDASGADIPFDATIDAATNVITVDPDTDFEGEKSIYACIDDQIEDFSDNAIPQTCVTFDTEDVSPPVVTLSPSNGEADVPIASGLIISLSEPVRKTDDSALDDTNVDALITLKIDDINGASLPFDAEVKLSRKKITVAPDNNFTSEQVIYYCIDPVEDESGNATSQTCATFTAEDIAAPTITIDPADATIDVPVDKIITFTSSEALKRVDGQALNDANVDDFINLHETSSSGAAINFDATIEAGSSVSFDGDDDYVDINTLANDMAGQTDWAVSFWAKPTIASFPEGTADIFSVNCDNGSNNCNKISINIKRDNSAIQVFEDPGGTTIAGSAISDGDWNHVVYSRTGSTGTLYLNGTLQGTHTPAHAAFAASDKWSLAHEFDGTTVTNEFFGLMDEVAFWNSDLAANEVIALYNSGISLDASTNSGDYTSSADIAGYWNMNEGTGTTLTDLSSNSNNGTINNATWEADSPSGNRIISVNPTDDLPSMQLVYVAIWAGVTDADGNPITPANSTFTTADAEPPTVTFDPADGVTDVVVSKT